MMRNRKWKIAIFIMVVLLGRSSAFAQGLSGWFDINNSISKDIEDGKRTSKIDTFNRNLYLNFQKPVTPMLSYQLNLRANWRDTDTTDADDITETAYQRSLEPAIDVSLVTPMYNLTAGYRRQEQWTTAHYRDDSRQTTEFYYSRLNVSPAVLPSVSLQFDKQKNFDHLSVKTVDDSNTTYSISSAYELPSRDLTLRYLVDYTYGEDKTPLLITNKTTNESFSTNYNIGYSGFFWNRKVDYSVSYQGNYSRNKNKQFITESGSLLFQRTPLGGFYAQGTAPPPNDNISADVLSSQGNLVDDDIDTSTGIGLSALGSDEYQNIGIRVAPTRPVDRLYIYVNQDISAETALNDRANWNVFKSRFNQANTWEPVQIRTITVTIVDTVDLIYRYEIEFLEPQSESFFKAVNREVSSVNGVFVTEIEAYGIDEIPDEDVFVTVTKSFSQALNFGAHVRPLEKLTISFNYFLDRSDQNPESFLDSLGGIFENIFSDSISDGNSTLRSTVTRNYGVTTTWLTHRLLTTSFRFQRSDAFDNEGETDISTNTYNLSFYSMPLPTLDADLSLIRNDTFKFNEKDSTSDSALLSINSKLHRDVNMITDLGITRSRLIVDDATSKTRFINGTLDALLTKRLSGTLSYGFNWSSSDDDKRRSKDGSLILTYRPGKFVNISGNVRYADSDSDTTTSEGVIVDWLPVRAVRLNFSFQHTDSDPGPVKTDSYNGFIIWYVTKFADVRFTYGYTRQSEDQLTESHDMITKLNCRF